MWWTRSSSRRRMPRRYDDADRNGPLSTSERCVPAYASIPFGGRAVEGIGTDSTKAAVREAFGYPNGCDSAGRYEEGGSSGAPKLSGIPGSGGCRSPASPFIGRVGDRGACQKATTPAERVRPEPHAAFPCASDTRSPMQARRPDAPEAGIAGETGQSRERTTVSHRPCVSVPHPCFRVYAARAKRSRSNCPGEHAAC